MNSGVAFSVSSLISGAVRQPWSSPTHRARRMNQHMHQTLTGPAHQQPSSLKTNVHNNPRDTNNLLCILWYVLLCTPLHGYVNGGRVIKKFGPGSPHSGVALPRRKPHIRKYQTSSSSSQLSSSSLGCYLQSNKQKYLNTPLGLCQGPPFNKYSKVKMGGVGN